MTTRAQAEKDWAWIKDAVRKLKYLWIVLLFCGLAQIAVSKAVYSIWINNDVIIPMQLSIVMFCYFIVTNWCSIYSNFLNGVGKIRLQLVLAVIGMIMNIPFAIFLIKGCHLGIIGIPIATISTMIVANIFGMIQYNKIIHNTATGIWNK
jgi:Na+-driven multidrug efflux pump